MQSQHVWLGGFKADYDRVFVQEWSPYVGAILLVVLILALMVNGSIWGVFGGVRFWGDQINGLLGLAPLLGIEQKDQGWLTHRMSLMNIMLLLGAFAAALMSRQFIISRPPKIEYLWAAFGGTLMGIGASLAGGCTTGGFFNPVLHSSPAGWTMAAGLLLGAILGLKLLMWALERVTWGTEPPPTLNVPSALVRLYPVAGLLIVLGVLAWTHAWYTSGDSALTSRAAIVVLGFGIGFVMHRARLCFARAFREPFMTAEGDMTKAILLALAVGIPSAAFLFSRGVIDPYTAIPATFWLGSLVGGVIFGIGMIFAGGCASGSLWRMGEGHLKLWVAMFFFAWMGSTASALLDRSGLTLPDVEADVDYEITALGFQAYWPELLGGWAPALILGGCLLLVWYAFVRYNESTERFTVV
ncbi:MAG: YeeE/YedE thiosulfate transporter family protein [Thiobacillaceae bacterium]|nr:YeeE/YedE thiosulfate transporter family protein [Thiobacillaceae bacterium]MCX7672268.1 YeeE/YedE thiosulfate transporter family protein [Thiobacillaceae bacterium]MDW8322944.1 YeeE/YedE thiosulfate transporter family protein [Burkholderiales bacterium]